MLPSSAHAGGGIGNPRSYLFSATLTTAQTAGERGGQREQRHHPDAQPQRDDQRQQTNGSHVNSPSVVLQAEDGFLFVAGTYAIATTRTVTKTKISASFHRLMSRSCELGDTRKWPFSALPSVDDSPPSNPVQGPLHFQMGVSLLMSHHSTTPADGHERPLWA